MDIWELSVSPNPSRREVSKCKGRFSYEQREVREWAFVLSPPVIQKGLVVTADGLDVCGTGRFLASFQLSWFLKITYNIPVQTCASDYLEWLQTRKRLQDVKGLEHKSLPWKLMSISIYWGKGINFLVPSGVNS